MMIDQIDQQIIKLLQRNSRLTNKEIGESIHLSGQAVGNRINRLLDDDIISNFTIAINYDNTQYIRLFMNQASFSAVEKLVNSFEEITSFDKVSGQACYLIIAHFTPKRLNEFIEVISKWARYSVETTLINKLEKH
ncbi:Lrp/AsnC family transcriptional regulator [Companilactobacillus kimchiensis]|nr:AsnC family transcriptional regulator [Companilactobacillus kimchiensis]